MKGVALNGKPNPKWVSSIVNNRDAVINHITLCGFDLLNVRRYISTATGEAPVRFWGVAKDEAMWVYDWATGRASHTNERPSEHTIGDWDRVGGDALFMLYMVLVVNREIAMIGGL